MTPSFPFIHGKALPDYILISMSIESKPELDHPSEGSQNLNTPSAPAPKVSDQQTPLCTQAHRIAHLLHLEKTYPPSVPGIPDLGKGRWRTHHLPYLLLFLTNKKMNSSLVLAAPTLGPNISPSYPNQITGVPDWEGIWCCWLTFCLCGHSSPLWDKQKVILSSCDMAKLCAIFFFWTKSFLGTQLSPVPLPNWAAWPLFLVWMRTPLFISGRLPTPNRPNIPKGLCLSLQLNQKNYQQKTSLESENMSPNSYWANQFFTKLAAYSVQNSAQGSGFVTQTEGKLTVTRCPGSVQGTHRSHPE